MYARCPKCRKSSCHERVRELVAENARGTVPEAATAVIDQWMKGAAAAVASPPQHM